MTRAAADKTDITHLGLTVVFMIPVPCVRMELAMCRMLMVFKCLLLLAFSIKICQGAGKKKKSCHNEST